MKRFIIHPFCVIIMLWSCESRSQSAIQLDYFPKQKSEINDKDYRKATYILKTTYAQIKGDSGKVTYTDYLNVATAYLLLKQPKEMVLEQLAMAQKKDLESTAELFLHLYKKENYEGYLSSEEYDSLHAKFTSIVNAKKEQVFDLHSYIQTDGYDSALVQLIINLKESDLQFRKLGNPDMQKQNILDVQNIKIIDSLYSVSKTYIGKSLVGEKFDYVMWEVIQHSDLKHQEYYLPIVHEAVKSGELAGEPLKMLIDRIYAKKYGYQIFGSQGGVDLGTEEEISKVKDKFRLN